MSVCAPEEAVMQIKIDEIMMSRVIITFLPLNGGRGGEWTEEGAGRRLPVTSSQHIFDLLNSSTHMLLKLNPPICSPHTLTNGLRSEHLLKGQYGKYFNVTTHFFHNIIVHFAL